MAIGAKEYIETVTYLSKMYDFFNEKLFGGALIKPVITIIPDEKNKAYGWITRDKLWKENENDEGMYEINLSAQFLNRPISEIASTLIHEMCHQFAKVNDFKDTARSGSFHNKLFRQIAEDHGLNVELNGGRGWAVTTLKESTKRLLDGFIEQNPKTPVYRVMPIKPNGYTYSLCGSIHEEDGAMLGRAPQPTYELALEDALKYALENLV